jgi:hypothetical protein
MEELAIGDKCKLVYGKNNKDVHNSIYGALLFYNPDKNGGPSSTVWYWENGKVFKQTTIDFTHEMYGKEKIEQYWKEILELDKNKKLRINTLCNTIDEVFFGKEKQIDLEDLEGVNYMYYMKYVLQYIIKKSFKK